MRKTKRILTALLLAALLVSLLCVPAFALTEAEVEAQVAASGKGAVTGNVLIWFLCAVAFLKVSQKIDSFMASLGVNVGHTGGSLLSEAMIAMRAVTMVVGGGHGGGASRAGSTSGNSVAGKSGSSGMAGFFKGGLVGMAGRHITNSAVRTATTRTSNLHTAQSQVTQAAASAMQADTQNASQTAADTHINSEVHTGGASIHTENSVSTGVPPQEGVGTSSGAVSQPWSVDTAPSDTSIPGGIPSQEGTILTGAEAASQPIPTDTAPSATSVPSGTPSQEGVVLTCSEPPAPVPVSGQMPQAADIPPVAPIPSGAPPQEGVILTGAEPPSSIPMADSVPQSMDTPPESIPADSIPPQGGVAFTEGGTTVHATQTAATPQSVAIGSPAQESVSGGVGSGQHTQTHTERSSQTAHTTHTTASSERVQTSRFHSVGPAVPTLGGMVFSHSLASGGSFANDVIGTVARGEVAGSITGDMAAQSLSSYMGYASPTIGSREPPAYSDVEIGRGRITGVETAAGTSQGLSFSMYHVDQYAAPTGEYTKVVSADGTQWYKQYAQDAVERKPYMAPDNTVAYQERIIKKLPDPPKRKDRI